MKKTLALVLALAMVFSTVTVAFAEETAAIGADAQVCADLGMLKGATGTVDAAYLATTPTRLQAAIMFLRLKGLEAEATGFTGTDNFADADKVAWAEGKAILAYLKAYPELGWKGDGTNFDPNSPVTAQQYYKVMLEALGYKQNTAEVVGDFTWENVLAFAAEKGLTKVAAVTNFTVNDVATATVEALKAKVKGVDKTLVDSLVEAGKVDKAKAVAAGLVAEKVEVSAAVDSAEALGNTVVEVAFDADVDAAAAGDASNYTIEGLEVKGVTVTGSDTVRLETAAMTAGKLYTLTVGEKSVKFTGIAKVSGSPEIVKSESTDVEEVVITFDMNMDYASATDVANYAIAGVEVVKAEVDGDKVTLTTNGLAARKQYTVKVTNVKSIDGGLLKSDSDSFYVRLDTTAPKIKSLVAETNQRLVLTFDEPVTKESAENLENYTIKTVVGGDELEVLSVVWDSEDEDNVEITTEVQAVGKKYELSVVNIVDQKKAANTLTKADTETFYGLREDTTDPVFTEAKAVSRNLVKVTFTDNASKLDESTILDANNYTLKKGTTEYVVESVEKVSSALKRYEALLTVEDMGVGSYSLEATAIRDEFNNEMDSDKEYFTVSNDTFASASFSAAITGENEVTLIFDKELKEASAEDIANYSIDGGIGAPVSATYTDDAGYKVVLKTNDLLDSVKYDITVNGVEDLAGNVLNHTIEDVTGTGWDDVKPELKDAYSVNKFVVALAFDEEIAETCVDDPDTAAVEGATLTLRDVKPASPDYTPALDVTLNAKALKDENTVVEFSNATGLVDNVTYFVYEIGGTGIKDLKGNAFTMTAAELANYEVFGTDETPDRLTVESIEQIDGKTYQLTMSGNVLLVSGKSSEYTGYTLDDLDGDEVIKFIKNTPIEENEEVEFNLSEFLTDEHGIAVLDEKDTESDFSKKTTFYAEYKDEEAPYIVNVVATDRFTVEVEYSEALDETVDFNAIFSVKNADADVSTAEMMDKTTATYADGTTVTITLKTPLQAIYDYELIILRDGAAGAQDVAGNDAEEKANETFTFNGTDLAQ